ncbi:MAG: 3'(2'),5'-bisphosphate nucleotidase [Cyanobacteria bacterium P01_H01_bin.121]
MGFKEYRQERQVALTAVLAAAQLCKKVRLDAQSQALEKPDRSPVTIADYGAQALICQVLAAQFPNDAIVGEEDAILLRTPDMTTCLEQVVRYVQYFQPQATATDVLAWIGRGKGTPIGRFWTLDPIDGTKGYVRGDQYAIALALIEAGQVVVAAIACPALTPSFNDSTDSGVVFLATRGQGATMLSVQTGIETPLKVNSTGDDPSAWRLLESVERDHGTPVWQQAIAQRIGLVQSPLQMDSLAKYGIIARGEAHLYMRLPSGASALRYENIWDHAAGVLVLTEAGGTVTDQQGKPLDFGCGSKLSNNQGIIASNGQLHAQVLDVLPGIVAELEEI